MTYAAQRGAPTPAIAAGRPEERDAHGVAWVDDYAWIRAARRLWVERRGSGCRGR
jgi:protease II